MRYMHSVVFACPIWAGNRHQVFSSARPHAVDAVDMPESSRLHPILFEKATDMKTVVPFVKRPVVDRLAFILRWACGRYDDQDEMLKPVRRRIAKAIEAGTCERAYPKGARYRENFRIVLDGGSHAYVQVGALIPERQKGGIRIVINPAKFSDGDAAQLNRVMRQIIGREYNQLMRRPLVNCIDFAADIHNANLSRMLVQYSNAQRMTVMAKRMAQNCHIEGYNFGSVSSDYFVVAYDKSAERIHAAILNMVKQINGKRGIQKNELLTANAIKQLKPKLDGIEVVRVEVRGKKLRGLPLYKLNSLPNRFARFKFADLNATVAALPRLTERAFLAMCRQDGLKAALDAFKHTKQARKVNAYWRSHQASWWKPEPMWQQACDAVREIGLFPDSAFEPWDE
jgi:hypothetical protein